MGSCGSLKHERQRRLGPWPGHIIAGLGLMGLFLCSGSCALNPVSGGPELMLVSEADEAKMGRETDAQVKKEYGVYDDPALTSYLDGMCQRIAKLSHRPHLTYHFKVVDASVVNAFAVPGGYVYFSRGILATLNNEAELAAVMGHEIGHITARHSAQQMSRAQLAQFGVVVGGIFLPDLISGLAQIGVGMLFLSFSRDNERQADDLGVEYASKAGYDAAQMANFFETLERMNPGSDRSGLPSWFSTHPSPSEREKTVRERAKEWQHQLGMKDPKVNRDTYLRQIDGLVHGEDPRQGYVGEGVFYHPELRFQFPVPSRWKLQNTATQVQMMSEGKDALMLLSLVTGMSARDAARTFVSKNNAVIIRSEPTKVNGLSAERLLSDVRDQSGVIRVLSYFIQKEKSTYVFHGLSSPKLFQKQVDTFESTMRQFKELSDPGKINVSPDRIRIQVTKKAESAENVFRSLGVPNDQLKEIALLNGMSVSEVIPANSLVKVIEKGR